MLRVLAESFVVSPPSGVTIKTRLRPTPAEEQALREVGTFLGSLYRADLVRRLREGKLDAQGRARSRKVRKKYLTAQSSSRWAGSITRATQDQYDLAVRALAAERAMLVAATGKLSARVAAPAGGRAGKIAGYRSQGERHGKTRRLAQLTSRLGVVDTTLASGRPSVVPGGRRLWEARNSLAQANLSVQAWECLWAHRRMFLSADGESGKRFGNETIRVDHTGHLSVKVAGALVGKLGPRLSLAVPVGPHLLLVVEHDRDCEAQARPEFPDERPGDLDAEVPGVVDADGFVPEPLPGLAVSAQEHPPVRPETLPRLDAQVCLRQVVPGPPEPSAARDHTRPARRQRGVHHAQAGRELGQAPGLAVPLARAAVPGNLARSAAGRGRHPRRQLAGRRDEHGPLGSQCPHREVVLVLGRPGDRAGPPRRRLRSQSLLANLAGARPAVGVQLPLAQPPHQVGAVQRPQERAYLPQCLLLGWGRAQTCR